MENFNTKRTKNFIYILLVLIIFFGFLSIRSFGKRTKEDAFLLNPHSITRNFKNIPNKLKNERLLLQIFKNIKNKKFEEAKKYISGDNSQDYFNKGTIKLIQSYDLAKQNDLTGLQQARLLIAQVNQDLEIADKIQLNSDLNGYIQKNKKTAENLLILIETKTCYQEGGSLISEIKNTLEKVDKIIDEQTNQLEKLNRLSSVDTCISNLINIITNNQIQLRNIKNELTKKEQDYKSIIGDKLNDPSKCKGTSFEDVLKKTSDAKKSMEEYLKQQKEISQILESPSPEGITQLCNGSKNDSQLNENLSNSVSQMMKDLQKQSEKEKNKDGESKKEQEDDKGEKKDGDKQNGDKKEEGEKKQEGDQQSKKGNGEAEYKDVLDQQERNILNQTQQNGNNLIKQIQQIKGQGNYNGYQYIKNLFNSFMGNEGDLKNLHEKAGESEGTGSSQTQRY